MISYRNNKAVKRLAAEYRMPESYIRQMLAIESGESTGDIKDVDRTPRCPSLAGRVWGWLVCVATLGAPLILRAHR